MREAFTLPLVFLTTALGGGVRVAADGGLTFVPPPLMSLVLAIMLLAALYRSGALEPAALMHPDRAALANLNGAVVLATLAPRVGADAERADARSRAARLHARTSCCSCCSANTLVAGPIDRACSAACS